MRVRLDDSVGAAIVLVAAVSGCGGASTGALGADGGTPRDATTNDELEPQAPEGGVGDGDHGTVGFTPGDGGGLLVTPQRDCPDGGVTSLSGIVYDPAGINPLYGAVVYIPSDPQARLPAIATGTGSCSASCNPMSALADSAYLVVTTTDIHGAFTLANVPAGKKIPLVIQLGKWRRTVAIDTRNCLDTTVPPSLTRLPRNQSEGDIPQMAILTGACDALPCFMRDLGLDANEFSGPAGGGRMHVYKGAGPGPDLGGGGAGPAGDCSVAGCPLWSTKAALEKYDLVLLGCECGAHDETKPDKGAIHDWLAEGGRVLATHYQDTWFKNGPADFQGVAGWLATESDGPTPGPFQVDTSFVDGNNLRTWLAGLGAFNPDGTLPLTAANVSTSVTGVASAVQRWVYDTSSSDRLPKLFSFPTPVGGLPSTDGGPASDPPYCGRAMFTDVHAGGGGQSSSAPVPASCTGGKMSAEEKALEFAFFNLSGPCYVEPPPHPGF